MSPIYGPLLPKTYVRPYPSSFQGFSASHFDRIFQDSSHLIAKVKALPKASNQSRSSSTVQNRKEVKQRQCPTSFTSKRETKEPSSQHPDNHRESTKKSKESMAKKGKSQKPPKSPSYIPTSSTVMKIPKVHQPNPYLLALNQVEPSYKDEMPLYVPTDLGSKSISNSETIPEFMDMNKPPTPGSNNCPGNNSSDEDVFDLTEFTQSS